MGLVDVLPADGLRSTTLRCCGCQAERSWSTPFYSDRVLALGVARREGWGLLADGMRRCPVCQAIATRRGHWGSLAHELRPGIVDCKPETEVCRVEVPVSKPRPPERKPALAISKPSGLLQLDLFGAAA